MSFMVPGEDTQINVNDQKLIIGPGLKKEKDKIIVTKSGLLKNRDNSLYWIESKHKRYVPSRNDHVIGTIVMRTGESFKVDIASSEYASLSYMAFENATKRNKPNMDIGDIVYCKILTGDKDIEPELVCIDSDGKANGMGHLQKGFVFRINLDYCRRLLSQSCPLIRTLGKLIKFEIAIGLNGLVWIKTDSHKETIILTNLIIKYYDCEDSDIEAFLKRELDDNKFNN